MNFVDDSFQRISSAIEPGQRLIFSLRNFGDCLHTSIAVNHYAKTHNVIWALSERYIDEFKHIGVPRIGLVHDATLSERQALIRRLVDAKYDGIYPCTGDVGWKDGPSIADAFLFNAGVNNLSVPRKPLIPIGPEDHMFARQFLKKHDLSDRSFICLEYHSYTLSEPPHSIPPVAFWNDILKDAHRRVVFIAAGDIEPLSYGTDARGVTFRQAKALIWHSKFFMGIGAGLTVLATSDGLNMPLYEVGVSWPHSVRGCGYYKARSLPIHRGALLEVINSA